MFRMTSAQEKYQKVISDVLVGCSGVANIANDLIDYGTDLAKHDSNPRQVLTRVRLEKKSSPSMETSTSSDFAG